MDFAEIVRNEPRGAYLMLGLYGQALQRWVAQHDRDRMRVYLLEDLARDANGLLRDLFMFIGVDASVSVDTSRRFNVNPTREAVPPRVRDALRPFYRDDILLTQDLISRDLSSWLT